MPAVDLPQCPTPARSTAGRKRTVAAIVGALVVAGALAWVLAGRREEFVGALDSAPLWTLLLATLLQFVALVSRTEAWHVCVTAAGGSLGRRRLYRAASVGYVGCQLNSQFGTAARIAVLRRSAGCPRVPAMIAAEVPILAAEAVLAAGASFTLVGPLGLPWWVPLACLVPAIALVALLRRVASRWRHGFCSGLAVLRSLNGRSRVIALVLVAVFAQIARNWLMLRAVGVHASVFDATAVLIAMVVLSQLPVGPSVGAAAVVLILGTDGVALAARFRRPADRDRDRRRARVRGGGADRPAVGAASDRAPSHRLREDLTPDVRAPAPPVTLQGAQGTP